MILRGFLVVLFIVVIATIFGGTSDTEESPREDARVQQNTQGIPSTALLVQPGQTIVGDQVGWIRIFREGATEPDQQFVAHEGAIHAIRPVGDGFATASSDGSIRIWDADGDAQNIHRLFDYHFNDAVVTQSRAVVVAADKGTVARIGSQNDWIQRLAHRKASFKLALSPDENQVASVGEDGFLRIWSVETGEELKAWKAHQGVSSVVAWQADDIITGGTVEDRARKTVDGEIRFWNVDGDLLRAPIRTSYAPITRMAISPDYIAILGESESVMVYDRQTGQHIETYRAQSGPVFSVAIDGHRIHVGIPGGGFQTWSVTNQP